MFSFMGSCMGLALKVAIGGILWSVCITGGALIIGLIVAAVTGQL